jgi:hypothetical protein
VVLFDIIETEACMQVLIGGKVQELSLKDGWNLVNDSNPYYDFENVLLTLPSQEEFYRDQEDYIINQITLERDADALSFCSAYLTTIRNVPHGDHKVLFTISLAVDAAIKAVFAIKQEVAA